MSSDHHCIGIVNPACCFHIWVRPNSFVCSNSMFPIKIVISWQQIPYFQLYPKSISLVIYSVNSIQPYPHESREN